MVHSHPSIFDISYQYRSEHQTDIAIEIHIHKERQNTERDEQTEKVIYSIIGLFSRNEEFDVFLSIRFSFKRAPISYVHFLKSNNS